MAPQTPEEEQTERGFTVADKRQFTKEGQRKPEARPTDAPQPSAPPPPRQEAPRQEAPPHDMPPADFSTFVAMMANNVMMFLGQIPDPATQQPRRDLLQAKHTIDILIMLRDKTQGNQTAEEEQLLQELLPQLQMAYVSVSKQAG
ncbi:MAG: DUF1844 domain-containing protein, partial [Candidatus Tectomicrobia bacterium]